MPKPFGYIATYLDVLPQLLDMTFIIPNTTHPMCFSLLGYYTMFRVSVLVQPSHLVIARRAWLHDLALVGLLVLHTL